MKPITILKRAKKLLSKPERWTKGELARNAKGDPVSPCDRSAKCFCAEGGLRRVSKFAGSWWDDDNFDEAFAALASTCRKGAVPPVYNDSSLLAHRGLMLWFDRAIKYLEKQS